MNDAFTDALTTCVGVLLKPETSTCNELTKPHQNENTLAEVRTLVSEQKFDKLKEKFFPRISFGTAGVSVVVGS
jgi:hypothetical protein